MRLEVVYNILIISKKDKQTFTIFCLMVHESNRKILFDVQKEIHQVIY